jgi:hypothetical protein
MTIGIAALATVGKPGTGGAESIVILAADRMLTDMRNLREYEQQDQTKLFKLSAHIGVLISGDGERFLEICRATQLKTASKRASVAEAARVFAAELRDRRNEYNEHRVLAEFGLTFETFHQRQRTLDPEFVSRLVTSLADSRFDIGDALIAGLMRRAATSSGYPILV